MKATETKRVEELQAKLADFRVKVKEVIETNESVGADFICTADISFGIDNEIEFMWQNKDFRVASPSQRLRDAGIDMYCYFLQFKNING